MTISKTKLMVPLLAVPLMMMPSHGDAVQVTTDAVIEVIDAPQITQLTDLQFGTVLRPTTGTNTIRVLPNGNRSIFGGGDGALAGGTVNAATYTIDAVVGQTIDVEAALQSAGGSGLGLSNFEGTYNGSANTDIDVGDGGSFPSVASSTLSVGGDITGLNNAITAATHTLTFTVDVNYQ